ncbi:hypothetical protein [Haladaptatus sp. DFWS20]|uniref:hypothetical protein n=1 Tax=Haladaptatus sp. DFWS20 TaxID=3403467 RepID=UPI003EBCFC1E
MSLELVVVQGLALLLFVYAMYTVLNPSEYVTDLIRRWLSMPNGRQVIVNRFRL